MALYGGNRREHLPNPISIAGSTLTVVLNRIHIEPKENFAVFLKSLETEQRYLTAYAHAPIESILAQLNPSDAAAFKAAKRQLLKIGVLILLVQQRERQRLNCSLSRPKGMGTRY